MDVTNILVGTLVGFVIAIPLSILLVIGLIWLLPYIPGAIEALGNKPNRFRGDSKTVGDYPVDEWGFFTSLAPGQVKVIMAGDDFRRCIMHYPGHTFKGMAVNDESTLPRNSREYWEVVSTTTGKFKDKQDAHPISDVESFTKYSLLNALIKKWSERVYSFTGYVFIGIYPYRKVHTYKLARYKKDQQTGEILKYEDYSDHYRVADFSFPVVTPEADTQDKVPVKVSTDNILCVYNPFMAAFGTNDWAQRVTSAVQDKVTGFTRPRPLDEVLSASSKEGENTLSEEVLSIGSKRAKKNDNSIYTFGIKTVQVLVVDITAVEPTGAMQQKLAGAAIARIDSNAEAIRAEGERKAMALRAKGRASLLTEQMEAVGKDRLIGLAVLAKERSVETADAAGDKAVVVVGNGGEVDPIQAAMLQELKDIKLRNNLALKE